MERAQCLFYMRRQTPRSLDFQAPVLYTFSRSRDERPSAEDFGAFMWPPRSYTCSFCTREFRSAQALGGHMNVHRRDRARLKQQSLATQNPDNEEEAIPSSSTDIENAVLDRPGETQNRRKVIIENPSPCFPAFPAQTGFPPSATPGKLAFNASNPKQSFISSDVLGVRGKQTNPEVRKKFREARSTCMRRGDHNELHDEVETNLAVGLNSVFCRNRESGTTWGDDAFMSYKRAKTTAAPGLQPSLPNDHKCSFELEFLGLLKPSAKMNDELDLELRLGAHRSTVK